MAEWPCAFLLHGVMDGQRPDNELFAYSAFYARNLPLPRLIFEKARRLPCGAAESGVTWVCSIFYNPNIAPWLVLCNPNQHFSKFFSGE